MTYKIITYSFIALIVDVAIIGMSSSLCPSFCVCDTWYGLHRVSCVGRHLYSIHTGAPDNVQALDASNNSISALKDHELADAGLSKLKYLNLSTNAINEIGLNAFDGLSELTILDLSQNHLYYLLSDIFTPTKSLRILRLSKNNFNSHIPKLECSWLTDLTLDSCQISHIPKDTFVGLSHLRKLNLSNNLMIQLDSVTLQALSSLRKLSIEGNPWSCNKLMYDLQIYLIHKNIEHKAVCVKMSGPKKFEKMILYNPQLKYEKNRSRIISNAKIDAKASTKILTSTSTPKYTTCINMTEEISFMKKVNSISPYWFFMIGFLIGNLCSMFTCYLWFRSKLSCYREYPGRRDNDTQRVSLLQDSWQFEDPIFNEDEHQTLSRSSTPPPPYREVMLRPGLYHSPPVIANLNNNT